MSRVVRAKDLSDDDLEAIRRAVPRRPVIDDAMLAKIMRDARAVRDEPVVSIRPALPAWEIAICVLVAVFLGFALAVQL